MLATSRETRLRSLLLHEAKLLESYAELREWMDGSDRSSAEEQPSETSRGRGVSGPSRDSHHAGPASLAGPGLLAGHVAARLGLQPADQQALFAPAVPRHVLQGEPLSEEGETLSSLTVLCSGMAKACRVLADGSEQIVAIFVAGDMLNAGDLAFRRARTSIVALTSAIALSIPIPALRRLMEDRPAIARALWRETAAQAAIRQEWMIGLGSRTAEARLAHFLCEMFCRLRPSQPDAGDGVDLPMTQHELSEVLGLSVVHVNRVLQRLRSAGLVEFNRARLVILDKAGLYAIAEFDEEYLGELGLSEAGSC
ncbi:MAG: Crp/Fnr family transcriptional regulator [Bradyrhizobium sp.]